MNVRRIFLLAVCAAASIGAAGRADAQCGYGCGGGFGYGYWDIGRLYGLLADEVPYYAAFPPVYYSYPVPRTYGYSPFAYPPGTMTPEVEMVEPLAITNPYFQENADAVAAPAEGTADAPVNRTTATESVPRPMLVVNPYMEQRPKLARR